MPQSKHPLRVRLYGGRAVRAAHDLNSGGHATACEYVLSGENHWQPPTAAVTCGRCVRVLNREFRAGGSAA